MASSRIKGITIEIDAKMTPLVTAIKEFDKQINSSKSALRDINKLLKADPKNVELLTQKQKALTEAIDGTKNKLAEEKKALEQLKEGPQTEQTIRQQENLTREIADTEQQLKSLESEYKQFGSVSQQQAKVAADAMKETGKKIQSAGEGIRDVGASMTKNITVPVATAFAGSAKAAIDWETAFTGVKKTVDATDAEYEQLADSIKEMSTKMASSKSEIAAVMEIAGQLGVTGVKNLEAFTKTAVMLGDTTNLSAEEAATSFARILNITGDGYDKVDRMGSAVVDLGNNMATSESEIVAMANRLASAGKISGLTTQEILALSASMSSVGIQAEAGGTAMAQTMKAIQSAVSEAQANTKDKKAQENLQELAKVAGMTADEFASAWKDKPMQAINDFIVGLSKIKDEGGDTFATLDELGMSGIRQSNMLQSLALASDQLAKATNISNKAWGENSALQNEADKRYATMAARLQQTKESLTNLAITVGERLMPYMDKLIELIDRLAVKFENLSDEQIDAGIKIAAFAAAVGPVLMAIGSVVIGIGKFVTALGAIKGAFAAGGIFAGVGEAFAGVGAAISGLLGPIALVAAAIAVWVHNWDQIVEAGQLFVERTQEHLTQISESWHAVTDALSVYLSAKWAEIKNTFSLAMEGIKMGVSIVWEFISGIFTSKIEFIKGVVDGGFAFVEETIRTRIENARTQIQTTLDGIRTAFEIVADLAKTWGEHLIGNFVNGIKSKISMVTSVVSGVASTIKGYLHFSEPDVGPLSDFNTWMPDMMKQMAQQIKGGIPLVESAMQDTAGAMKGGYESVDYSGQLASINSGISQLATAGGATIEIPLMMDNIKLAQAVASVNLRSNYRSGGR